MAVQGDSRPAAVAGAVQLDVTAKLVMADAVAIHQNTILVQNLGPDPIYLGWSSAVTTATGIRVAENGGIIEMPVCRDDVKGPFLYGITTVLQVSPLDTRFVALR